MEIGGKIAKKSISILINLGSTHTYVSPKVVESCYLGKVKHNKVCLFQLVTRTKRKVSEVVMDFPIELNGILTKENLNVIPLGSYDGLISMDWLENHKVKVDCYEKVHECIVEEGRPRLVRGFPKKVLVRNISSL